MMLKLFKFMLSLVYTACLWMISYIGLLILGGCILSLAAKLISVTPEELAVGLDTITGHLLGLAVGMVIAYLSVYLAKKLSNLNSYI